MIAGEGTRAGGLAMTADGGVFVTVLPYLCEVSL